VIREIIFKQQKPKKKGGAGWIRGGTIRIKSPARLVKALMHRPGGRRKCLSSTSFLHRRWVIPHGCLGNCCTQAPLTGILSYFLTVIIDRAVIVNEIWCIGGFVWWMSLTTTFPARIRTRSQLKAANWRI
jgi:hypothetical protein